MNGGLFAFWNATYTPSNNFSGSDQITYKVCNPNNSFGNCSTADGVVSITINPVNDLPTISAITDVAFDEDGSYAVAISFGDVDSNPTVSVSSSTEEITVSLDSGNLTIDSADDYFGSSSITVTVSDEDASVA